MTIAAWSSLTPGTARPALKRGPVTCWRTACILAC